MTTRRRSRLRGLSVSWLVLACLACEVALPDRSLELPRRSADALGASDLIGEITSLDVEAREKRVYEEFASGNVPSWMRRFEPVEISRDIDGRRRVVTFWAAPDYVTVGSDDDPFIVPLSPQTAQRIADRVDASLPTPRMVDAIWAAASSRLPAQRIQPSDSIESVRTVGFFRRHNDLVWSMRFQRHVPAEAFVAGHKKDVVVSTRLADNPGKVAIYGWHGRSGEPVQPLSTAANESWVYYSHGARLVHNAVLVDGEERRLQDVLRDPALAPLLSDEGVIVEPRYTTGRTTASVSPRAATEAPRRNSRS